MHEVRHGTHTAVVGDVLSQVSYTLLPSVYTGGQYGWTPSCRHNSREIDSYIPYIVFIFAVFPVCPPLMHCD